MANSQTLIDAISKAVKDPNYNRRSKPVMASIATDAQDYLVDQLEMLTKIDSTTVVIVGGTQEYNMPADFIKFETRQSNNPKGYVTLGNNGEQPLLPTTTDILDSYRPNWRGITASTPSHFYIRNQSGDQLILGFFPTPSAAYVTQYGSVSRIRYVYRPPALNYDTNFPFDGADTRWRGLQYLLKLHATWQIAAEDMMVDKALEYDTMLKERMEQAKDLVESTLIMPSAVGFTPYGKNIL